MKPKKTKKATGLIIMTILAFLTCVLVVSAVFVIVTLRQLPASDQFGNREVSQSTKLYDRTGQTLIYEIHGNEKRTIIPFNEIPDVLKKAVLAAEDDNFYNQPAFDWKAIVRAFITDIKTGKLSQGGSTISQQLVKNTLLSNEKTITRKVKEIILAIELESKYSKDEIFSFYLNQIPIGSNAYGVEAASQTYFGKHAKDLTTREASIIASMLQAPSYFSPWGSHTKELFERSDYVLGRMVSLGFISEKEASAAKKQKVEFAAPSLGSISAPHFSLAVKDYLINKYGEQAVENGGLSVITTLDTNLQLAAEKAVKEGVQRNTELYNGRNGALIAEDPKTGQILAMVGSKDYFGDPEPAGCTPTVNCLFEGNFNVATQGLRQPGSALKPFVYLTAFQKGYSPKTVLFDVPTEFDTRNDPATSYRPGNFDGLFRGPVHMEEALAQSLNVPAVKTLYLAGMDDVLKNLSAFGISTLKERWRYGLSLTLGGGEIKLIDLVKAYSVLSQEGTLHEQQLVLKVTDSKGNILEEYTDKSSNVVDPEYPKLINQILSNAELRSPIFHASLPLTVFDGYDVALKTGTTQDYRDAWTFGYTPDLVVGVWAGNNDNTPMKSQGSSILAAVPMWSAFMKEALPSFKPDRFNPPDSYSLPSKTMLNGEAVYAPVINGVRVPQAHSILYYVDKTDPLGGMPDDPSRDSQFSNWERGVTDWLKQNPGILGSYVNTGFQSGAIPSSQVLASVSIGEPKNAVFVTTPFLVDATLKSSNDELARVELYFNNRLIGASDISGTTYHYQASLNLPLEAQNQIEIKTRTKGGIWASDSVMVYH